MARYVDLDRVLKLQLSQKTRKHILEMSTVNGLNDEEMRTVLTYAFRYAVGRHWTQAMLGCVDRVILENLEVFRDEELNQLIKDIKYEQCVAKLIGGTHLPLISYEMDIDKLAAILAKNYNNVEVNTAILEVINAAVKFRDKFLKASAKVAAVGDCGIDTSYLNPLREALENEKVYRERETL